MGFFERFRSGGRNRTSAGESDAAASEQDALRLIDEGNVFEQQGGLAEAMQRYEAAIALAPGLARAHLNRGNVLLETGDPDGALAAYATALVNNPDYAAAHYNTGNAQLRSGRPAAAVPAYRKAIALDPSFVDAEVGLGTALEGLGQLDDAVACYRRALALDPAYAEVHSNLGDALHKLGRPHEAVTAFRRALAIRPDYAEVHFRLGNVLKELGQIDDAVASYRRAVAIRSDFVEAHNGLGIALKDRGQPDDAVASFTRALVLMPESAEVHCNLGNALKDLGQIDGAIASYRRALAIREDFAQAHNNLGMTLSDTGQLEDAVASFSRALALSPDYSEAHDNLGTTLRALGQIDAAVASYSRALAINPDFAGAHCNLASVLYERGQVEEALATYRHALTIKPALAVAHRNVGMILKELGDLEAALSSLNQAVAIDPDDADLQSDLLFIHNYLADEPIALSVEAARRYGDLVARHARPNAVWRNVPDPTRRLRVGFVSGDLRDHAAGHFTEAALRALASDPSHQVEIIAYPTHFLTDAVTERIRASCHGWHSALGLPDEQLAGRIRDDGIDILIDLSGHTAHNRLPMFAWKAAPVQATWIGYFATTGVRAIDYLIADPWTLPQSEEVNFTEKIWRLPETRLCFTVPDVDVQVAQLPALHRAYVTFGCFNNLAKVNDRVVAVWAEVLAAVPHSRLFLKSAQIGEPSVRQGIADRFAAHGVAAERLLLEGRTPLGDYLAAYHRVDIALDPLPYTGGATTVQALWMGVPVLTLAGERFVSRQGIGLLMNVGLPEWVATDAADYVARAVAHAGDLPRLALLRSGLRDRALSSPIFDAPRFANHLAAALRGMWQEWCRTRQDRPA